MWKLLGSPFKLEAHIFSNRPSPDFRLFQINEKHGVSINTFILYWMIDRRFITHFDVGFRYIFVHPPWRFRFQNGSTV
uniref:Uncharacterized protein n=1 Tax=Arundo donax TaxID=35708 RepID=A0A0A9GQL0_ARUDO